MITTDDALATLCEAVREFPAIALDTEFVRTRTYYPQLGLIQLFDGKHVALIDPQGSPTGRRCAIFCVILPSPNSYMQVAKIWKCFSTLLANCRSR
jgi:ribonuclease D